MKYSLLDLANMKLPVWLWLIIGIAAALKLSVNIATVVLN